MNGLEISERYFWDHGKPLIEQKFGLYKERIASGLIGEGSECFGFDDEISRDHDWGPLKKDRFTLHDARATWTI